MTLKTAEIIAVGSELLSPYRSDTNSLFLAGRLNDCGIALTSKCVMPDDCDRVREQVRLALSRSDVVILTGGLGPTADDVTREAVADALSLELDEDPTLIAALEERFRARGVKMAAINRKQAQVPRGAVVLRNDRGTAPGLWIDAGDRVVVLLPGPPRELQPLVDSFVSPRLSARTSGRQVRRRVIKITGRAESAVDEVAQPIYSTFLNAAVPIDTSILATPGQIELHLSASGADVAAIDAALDSSVTQLTDALGPVVFSVDGRSLEEVVGAMLLTRGLHIAVAESCTGGLVLGKLTEVPGSSGWVAGGVVAYDNDVKIRQLGVPGALLAEHGAVSEPVAVAMATGVRERLGAEVGCAVTGIAGPTGGSDAKPVGTVVIAVAASETVVKTYRFLGDRQMVRQFSVAGALDLVRRAL